MDERSEHDHFLADYRELLRRGSMTRKLAPQRHAVWRRTIRAAARSDGLTVRTWVRPESAQVWAVLPGWSFTTAERARIRGFLTWVREE